MLILRREATQRLSNREEDAYGQNEDYHFGVYATDQGWLAAKSKEGYELTFCPDHVGTAKEMGLF